jgi:outer membrane biosynthesis protein TonB
MKVAYTISGIGHAAVLLWSVWSLAAKPLPAPPPEALPVDLVTVSDFTKMMSGNKDAPKAETPKPPVAEKIDEVKPPEDVTAKIVEKKEVKAAREPPPAPEAKPVEQRPDKAKAEPKPDPIADALAKEQAKKPESKTAETKTPTPPRKPPAPPAPKFDPNQVAALLNKQEATRLAAAGPTLNSTPSVGLPKANAATLSLSELDALRQRLMQLWTLPAGAQDLQELIVVFRIRLKPDGKLDGWPTLVSSGKSPVAVAARESAARAINRGQPFDMLKPENYELWKDIEITFDPRDMMRQ